MTVKKAYTTRVFPKAALAQEPSLPYGENFTYADYFSWKIKERFELIRGKLLRMSPGPNLSHQRVSGILFNNFFEFLKSERCQVFSAPFDVRFMDESKDDDQITTVLQPDIMVVCDPNKLDEKGIIGAPELVVEILSPSTSKKDLKYKYEIYETYGVLEYWVIHPTTHTLLIYTLENSVFQPSRLYTHEDTVTSVVLPGFELALDDIFGESPE